MRHFDTGSPNDITVRVFGPSFGTLAGHRSAGPRRWSSHIDGVAAARMDRQPVDQPNVEVEVDLEKAKQIRPEARRRAPAAATMLAGLEVGSLFEQQKVFQVTVWSTPDSRTSVTGIKNVVIDTPSGGHVRLEDVADVRIAPRPR